MYNINHDQKTLASLAIFFLGLLAFVGCKRNVIEAGRTNILPGLSRPVRVSSGDVDAAEPAIASSSDGSVYVVWVNHGPKLQADVMIARFTGDGQMQGTPERVNTQAGTATAWRGDPPTVAVAADHTIYVGWTARTVSESGHDTDIYLSSSRDNGLTFNVPVKVNDDVKPAVHGMHSLAVGNDGRVYVAWLDERNVTPIPMKDMKMEGKSGGYHMESNREVFFSSSSDGGHTFTSNRSVAKDACPCCKTALAIDPEGRVYLSWRQVLPGDFRHIAIASSADSAKEFSRPVIVSDDQWVLKGCPVSGASLSAEAGGKLRVLWYAAGEKGEHGIYLSESQDGGQAFSPRQLLAATNAHGTPVLLKDQAGRVMGVWEASENGVPQLMFARWPINAQARNDQHMVTNGELPAAAATGDRLFIVSLKKDGEKQNIWLLTAPRI